MGDYHRLAGKAIPFKQFGYCSLEAYLRSLPHLVNLKQRGNVLMCHVIADERTNHLKALVSKQKSTKKGSFVKQPHALPHARDLHAEVRHRHKKSLVPMRRESYTNKSLSSKHARSIPSTQHQLKPKTSTTPASTQHNASKPLRKDLKSHEITRDPENGASFPSSLHREGNYPFLGSKDATDSSSLSSVVRMKVDPVTGPGAVKKNGSNFQNPVSNKCIYEGYHSRDPGLSNIYSGHMHQHQDMNDHVSGSATDPDGVCSLDYMSGHSETTIRGPTKLSFKNQLWRFCNRKNFMEHDMPKYYTFTNARDHFICKLKDKVPWKVMASRLGRSVRTVARIVSAAKGLPSLEIPIKKPRIIREFNSGVEEGKYLHWSWTVDLVAGSMFSNADLHALSHVEAEECAAEKALAHFLGIKMKRDNAEVPYRQVELVQGENLGLIRKTYGLLLASNLAKQFYLSSLSRVTTLADQGSRETSTAEAMHLTEGDREHRRCLMTSLRRPQDIEKRSNEEVFKISPPGYPEAFD
ncbi:unnamed protein product [Darwinula stevensoni]|uniref:HTH OST-type domain-containing protein n=1 Tax=Darwinula stevensoni TaxID=69355 RepID=A0A7R8XCS5_9CRUS|nr:unnamed protein product [Darwinula stevensoni]CAG0892832.1 unnamed protein product [Darwinula stevensoni]